MSATACRMCWHRGGENTGQKDCAEFEFHVSTPVRSADSMTLQRKGMLSEDFAEGLKKDE
jgi:hypothetical protein